MTDAPRLSGRILVVEDDELQAESLAFLLRREGHVVELATTGAAGLARARSLPTPNLVLLDVTLPDLSGVEIARRLRRHSMVPIVMLTARRQETDRVVGLDAGADDYVLKPFSPHELLARIRAQLRRGAGSVASSGADDGIWTIGALRIDVGTRRVTRAEQPIDLSAREFKILRVLAEADGQVVERQEIFDRIWGPEFYGDVRALDVYIRMIRRKIEPTPSQPTFLHTLRGVGFRLAELGSAETAG